jgi:hypothetical protein
MPIIALLFAAGFKALYSSLNRRAQPLGMIGLLLLFGFNLYQAGIAARQWGATDTVQTAYHADLHALALHTDRTVGQTPMVVCAQGIGQETPPQGLTPTQIFLAILHHPFSSLRFADCTQALIFANGGEAQQWIFTDATTRADLPPMLSAWTAQAGVLTDGRVPLGRVLTLDVSTALADQIGLFTTTATAYYAPETANRLEPVMPPIRFGGNLTFLGYQRDEVRAYRPGNILTLVTYWRVDGELPDSLRLFAHVQADPAAAPAAQTDRLSVRAAELRPRDIFMQVTYIFLPNDLPPGSYDLSIGAYLDRQGNTLDQRLDVFDANQQPLGGRLFLPPILVESN